MRGLLAVAIGLLPVLPCLAAGGIEHWSATSNTATSITGDVKLKPSEIVFGNGKSLSFTKLKNISFTDDTGKVGPATIYQINKPDDPLLLQGNRICGGGDKVIPVTFIVIWRPAPFMPGVPVGRAFAAYSGMGEPPPTARGACATYRYEVAK